MKQTTLAPAVPAKAMEEVASAAPSECKPALSFRFNLSFDNRRVDGYGALYDTVVYLSDGCGNVSVTDIADIEEIRYIQYVGCAALEYDRGGETFELCRSDMINAADLQSVTKRLRSVSEGRGPGTPDPFSRTHCEKCGRRFMPGSNVCTYCVDRRRLVRRLLPFAKPYAGKLALSVLLCFAISAVGVITPYFSKQLINDYISNPDIDPSAPGVFPGFLALVLAIAAAGLLTAGISAVKSALVVKASSGILVDLRDAIYRSIQKLSLAGVSRRTAGELINRVTEDTQTLREFLAGDLPDIIQQGLVLGSVTVVMFFIDWRIALIVLAPVPIMLLVFSRLMKYTNRLYNSQWHASSECGTILHDIFSGIRVVKVFGNEEYEEKRFDRAARKLANISVRNERIWNLTMPVAYFALALGEYAAIYILGGEVLRGSIGLGDMSQVLSYVAMIYGPVRWMASVPRRITRTVTSMTKVFEIIDEEPDVADAADCVSAPIKGDISFRHAYFGYNNYENVLKDINIDIKTGEMAGIVGRSGVGKSTLINLIMRLYDLTGGELLIDGKDIRSYSQHSLRGQIGVVLQETYLFRGTVYDNIAYARPGCTPEQVLRASRLANAHQFIVKLPDGYNTYVGERGQTLSGGEKQRIAIARAVLRDPRILILDEATASLDTETERLVQDAVNSLTRGRTTIAIAHRLSTLRNATKLIVLEKGTVEETGTHEQLIQSGGRYCKLVMAQRKMSKMLK
ncbi:MAG: ABC transporter ATP-binding protein [Eubacteriales bacterium]